MAASVSKIADVINTSWISTVFSSLLISALIIPGIKGCDLAERSSRYVGGRDSEAAMIFMDDLAKRLANRVQLTSDGHKAYLEGVEGAFGSDVELRDAGQGVRTRAGRPASLLPAECIGAVKHRVEGNPDPKHVSTSFSERQNLSMRMGNRRMTRLTNAFSKKAANHAHMMAIYFMHYNFVRIDQTNSRCSRTDSGNAGIKARSFTSRKIIA